MSESTVYCITFDSEGRVAPYVLPPGYVLLSPSDVEKLREQVLHCEQEQVSIPFDENARSFWIGRAAGIRFALALIEGKQA